MTLMIDINVQRNINRLEHLTNRQLVQMKRVANVSIKSFDKPYTVRKTSFLLRNLQLVKNIDSIQSQRHKLAVIAFYSCPADIRDKKINRFISEFYDLTYHD